jgi:hypothetical protein
MWRVIVVLLAMLVTERVAEACCLGCACTKYKDRDGVPEIYVVQDIPPGYTRSVKGALPAWSIERITKFLTVGTWKPHPTVLPKGASRPTNVRVVPAPVLRFITAEQAGEEVSKTSGLPVLIRRIEKHGRAILVEVDDRTYKLAACPKQPGFVCLLPPGTLALRPIPPPGDSFAEPPP